MLYSTNSKLFSTMIDPERVGRPRGTWHYRLVHQTKYVKIYTNVDSLATKRFEGVFKWLSAGPCDPKTKTPTLDQCIEQCIALRGTGIAALKYQFSKGKMKLFLASSFEETNRLGRFIPRSGGFMGTHAWTSYVPTSFSVVGLTYHESEKSNTDQFTRWIQRQIVHELTHQLKFFCLPVIIYKDAWFEEGIAEYCTHHTLQLPEHLLSTVIPEVCQIDELLKWQVHTCNQDGLWFARAHSFVKFKISFWDTHNQVGNNVKDDDVVLVSIYASGSNIVYGAICGYLDIFGEFVSHTTAFVKVYNLRNLEQTWRQEENYKNSNKDC
jgi:hypothetical protein